MRDFKFRAWRKSENQFEDEEYWRIDGGGNIDDYVAEDEFGDDLIIQQFTELFDKNGKEIWEGDICLLDNSEFIQDDGTPEDNDLAPITYNKKYGAFYYEPSAELLGEVASELKVVGNIFENPELCK